MTRVYGHRFTDIMTVVVMIFLMALVIIMVRNSDLNRTVVEQHRRQPGDFQLPTRGFHLRS